MRLILNPLIVELLRVVVSNSMGAHIEKCRELAKSITQDNNQLDALYLRQFYKMIVGKHYYSSNRKNDYY